MKKFIQKLLAFLMVLVMLFDAAPMAAVADAMETSGQQIDVTDESGVQTLGILVEDSHVLTEGEYTIASVGDTSELLKMIGGQEEAGPKRGAAVTLHETGAVAYEIKLTDDAADAKQYQVTVPVGVDMLASYRDTDQIIAIDRVSYQLYHFHTDENGKTSYEEIGFDVSDDAGRIEDFTFTTSEFSTFMLKYTVDFHYNGKDYSMEGNTQILLSDLIEQLNIMNGDAPLDVKDVYSVAFTDEHLVKVEQVSGLIAYNSGAGFDVGEKDFLLSSEAPFTTDEKLTITLTNGKTIEIGVTDNEGPTDYREEGKKQYLLSNLLAAMKNAGVDVPDGIDVTEVESVTFGPDEPETTVTEVSGRIVYNKTAEGDIETGDDVGDKDFLLSRDSSFTTKTEMTLGMSGGSTVEINKVYRYTATSTSFALADMMAAVNHPYKGEVTRILTVNKIGEDYDTTAYLTLSEGTLTVAKNFPNGKTNLFLYNGDELVASIIVTQGEGAMLPEPVKYICNINGRESIKLSVLLEEIGLSDCFAANGYYSDPYYYVYYDIKDENNNNVSTNYDYYAGAYYDLELTGLNAIPYQTYAKVTLSQYVTDWIDLDYDIQLYQDQVPMDRTYRLLLSDLNLAKDGTAVDVNSVVSVSCPARGTGDSKITATQVTGEQTYTNYNGTDAAVEVTRTIEGSDFLLSSRAPITANDQFILTFSDGSFARINVPEYTYTATTPSFTLHEVYTAIGLTENHQGMVMKKSNTTAVDVSIQAGVGDEDFEAKTFITLNDASAMPIYLEMQDQSSKEIFFIDIVDGGIVFPVVLEDETFIYKLNEDGETLSIVSLVEDYSGDGNVTIPATKVFEETTYPVTAIKDEAFKNESKLASVTFSNTSPLSIGAKAFYYCSNLTSVSGTGPIASIATSAFEYSCTDSGEPTISLTAAANGMTIAKDAFFGAKATSVEINGLVTSLGDTAFCYCHQVKTIAFQANDLTISSWTFYSCENLENLNITGTANAAPNITISADNAFSGCSKLHSLLKGTQHLYNGLTIAAPEIGAPLGAQLAYATPNVSDAAKSAAEAAAKTDLNTGNTRVCYTSLILKAPDGTEYTADGVALTMDAMAGISFDAVAENGAMKAYLISGDTCTAADTVTPIAEDGKITALKLAAAPLGTFAIAFVTDDDRYHDDTFYYEVWENIDDPTDSTATIIGLYDTAKATVTIGNKTSDGLYTITDVAPNSFTNNTSIKKIVFANSSEFIVWEQAFKYMKGLEAVELNGSGLVHLKASESAGYWGGDNFGQCPNLKTISGTGDISFDARFIFSGCSSLESVKVGNIDVILQNTFIDNNNLKTVEATSIGTIQWQGFNRPRGLETLYVHNGIPSMYGTAIDFAGSGNEGTRTITLKTDNANLGYLNEYANSQNDYINKVGGINLVINNTAAVSFSDGALKNADLLKSVTVGAVENIGDNAFSGCTGLTSVSIGGTAANTVTVKQSAFSGCTALTTFTCASKANMENSAGIVVYDAGDAKLTWLSVNSVEADDEAVAPIAAQVPANYNAEYYDICLVDLNGASVHDDAATVVWKKSVSFAAPGGEEPDVKLYHLKNGSVEEVQMTYTSNNDMLSDFTFTSDFSYFGLAYNTDSRYHDDMYWYELDETDPNNITATIVGLYDGFEGDTIELRAATNDSNKYPVTGIAEDTFKDDVRIKAITGGNNLDGYTINTNDYAGMNALESVTIGTTENKNGRVTIKANAFSGCTALKNFTYNYSSTTIEADAFSGCAELKTVVFTGKDNLAIAKDAFKGAPNIKYLRIDNPYDMEEEAFAVTNGKAFVQNNNAPLNDPLASKIGKFDTYVFATNPWWMSSAGFDDANTAPSVYFANPTGITHDIVSALKYANSALKDVYFDCLRENFPYADELDEAGIHAKIHYNENTETRGFYLDGVNGDDETADGSYELPYKTFGKLAADWASLTVDENAAPTVVTDTITGAVQEAMNAVSVEKTAGTFTTTITKEKIAYIKNTVTVSNETWDDSTSGEVITLNRDPNFKGVMVQNNGTLTLQDVILDGGGQNGVTAANAMIISEGYLYIQDGAVLRNNYHPQMTYPNGAGAIYAKGYVEMTGGEISGNKGIMGGGIMLIGSGTVFDMSGGLIDGNSVCRNGDYTENGGGVAITGGAQMNFSGGKISNNVADNGDDYDYFHGKAGGGISVGGNNTALLDAKLVMTGGEISENYARNNGGGIYVECSCEAEISGGVIKNNRAENGVFSGGGIYVNGKSGLTGIVRITDVLVKGNTSDDEGGGLAGCNTSRLNVYQIDGGAIYGNNSSDGSDFYVDDIYRNSYGSSTAYVSPYMFNGAAYNWSDPRTNHFLTPGELARLQKTDSVAELKANPGINPGDLAAPNSAPVEITGNYAGGMGGGIGSNGTVIIGKEPQPKEVSMSPDFFKMVLNRDMKENEKFTFSVYREDVEDYFRLISDKEYIYCIYKPEVLLGTATVSQLTDGTVQAVSNVPEFKTTVTVDNLKDWFTLLVVEDSKSDETVVTEEQTYYAFTYIIGFGRNGDLDAFLFKVEKGKYERNNDGTPNFNAYIADTERYFGETYYLRDRTEIDLSKDKPLFTNYLLLQDISADKTWLNYDGSDTPPTDAKVVFELYADGKATDKKITLDGTVDTNGEDKAWTATWKDLDVYQKDENNKPIVDDANRIAYTVKEVSVTMPEGSYALYTSAALNTAVAATSKESAPITNVQILGGLTVKKTVVSDAAADHQEDKKFTFTVTLGDTSIGGNEGKLFGDENTGMTFKNGVATFELHDGESRTATRLPAGVPYTIVETMDDGFTTSIKGVTEPTVDDENKTVGTNGTITKNGDEVEFINTRETGDLEISKTLISDRAADADQVFTFTVTLDGLTDEAKNKTYGDVTLTDGEVTIELKGGESKTIAGLPTGITYTVTEADATGFELTGKTGDEGTISTTLSEAKFENSRETGDLKISKTLISDRAADADQVFTFTVALDGLTDEAQGKTYSGVEFTGGVATIELKGGESKTIEGLPTDITYTVTEADATGFELTGKTGDEGTITTTLSEAEFTNSRETGDLEISKTLISDRAADANQVFTFTVALDGLTDEAKNKTYSGVEFTGGVATIELKGGESKTIEGLPTDITYTVTEADATGFELTGKTGNEGTISTTLSEAKFENSRETGDLEISKTLISERAADADQVFTFTVALDGLTDEAQGKTYSGVEFTGGVATIQLKGGESKLIKGLPTDITYTVTEADATGFKLTGKTGDEGTISTTLSEAEFTNSRETGGLEISKIVAANTDAGFEASKDQEFTFTVTLDGLTDEANNKIYSGVQFTDGVSEAIILKHGQSKEISGLPTEITYTVKETHADGYTTTYQGETGEISIEKSDAKVTNTKDVGSLTVKKTVVSPVGYDEEERTFHFKVELGTEKINGVDTPINGEYGDMTFVNGVYEFDLKNGEELTTVGLPAGITYKVTETAEDDFDTVPATHTYIGTIQKDETIEAAYNNARKLGKLQIQKTVKSPVEKEKTTDTFKFTITLDDPTNTINHTFTGTPYNVTFSYGVAELELKDGEKEVIEGLPLGMGYTVTEETNNNFVTTYRGETGTVTKNGPLVDVTNTRKTGDLTVSKKVVSPTADHKQQEFEFTVTLLGSKVKDGVYGDMTFENNVATFKLKDNEKATATGLPADVNYSVVETTSLPYFETTDSGNTNGTISDTETPVVVFTNTYHASGSTPISVEKELTGREYKDGDVWTVTLSAVEEGAPMPEYTVRTFSKENQKADFGSINFTEKHIGKTYTYKIVETGDIKHVTNDTIKIVTITVEDNKDGKLNITNSSVTEPIVFVNAYTTDGTTPLKATKLIKGRDFQPGDTWTFTVEAEDGTPMPERTEVTIRPESGASAEVDFGKIKYTQADIDKFYEYTITESITPALPGVTNDTVARTVTVKVEYDEDTKGLSITNSSNEQPVVFTNVYKAEGEITFKGTKTIEGRAMTADDVFTFEVKEGDKLVGNATNDATGKIDYPTIKYTEKDVGEHTYTVKETSESGKGITADGTEYTVIVNVTDNGDGTLTATATSGNADALDFNNPYEATGSLTLAGTKTITRRAMTDSDMFSFKVEEVVPAGQTGYSVTVYNDVTGKINYPTISYTLADLDVDSATGQPKETAKTYRITETSISGNGITVDPTVYTVKVNISDNGDGTLKVVKTIDSDDPTALDFNNPYNATGKITFAGTKTLEGRALTAQDEFTFEIKEIVPEGKIGFSATAKNDATGKIKYPTIPYTLDSEKNDIGEHTYTVKETSKDGKGVTVDTKEYTVIVNVSDNGNGTLAVAATENATALNFVNQYEATGEITFEGVKILEGRKLNDQEFIFQVVEQVGKDTIPVGKVHNNAEGKILYPTISYTLADVGEHTYIVSELPTKDQNVDIDTLTHTIKVTVSDNGDGTLKIEPTDYWNKANFVNTYHANGEYFLQAVKMIEGREFAEGDEWTFTVTAADGTPMPEKTKVTIRPASGNVVSVNDFGAIRYTVDDVGEYTYTITESGTVKNVTNAAAKTVTVTVRNEKGDGTLTITSTADEEPVVFINTFADEVKAPLKAYKILENRSFKKDDKWTFTVSAKDGTPMPENTQVVITPENGNSADVDFGEITFTEADIGKIYIYTITESGTVSGVTNDTAKTVTMTVKYDSASRGLVVNSSADEENEKKSVTFVNVYDAVGTITLEGSKTLVGRELKEGEFYFEIREGSELIDTVSNGKDGKFSFAFDYTLDDVGKTFNYIISEVKAENSSITFDDTSYNIQVKVSDNGDGTLAVKASDNAKALKFVNTYKQKDNEYPLTGTKYMEGRDFCEGDKFTFIVSGHEATTLEDAPLPEKTEVTIKPVSENKAPIDFGKIRYTQEDIGKTFVYTVSEYVSDEDKARFEKQSVYFDTELKKVTIKVEDGGDGTLKITSSADQTPLVFTNSYKFATWIPLTAFKELQGRSFQKGDSWTFTVKPKEVNAPKLMDSDNVKSAKEAKPVTITPEKDNLATINLGYLHFDQNDIGKTYTYTITESGKVDGVTNDSAKTVEIQVTYNPKTYEIEVVSSSGDQTTNVMELTDTERQQKTDTVTFKNKYDAIGSITFKGIKTLTGHELLGRNLLDEEFSFEVKEGDQIVQTVYNDANGNILFKPITYKLADVGKHTYKVSEVKGEENAITKDEKNYTVKIEVTDNGDGTLKAEPIEGYADPLKLDFENQVKTSNLLIKKQFKDSKLLTAEEKPEEFPVTVKLWLEDGTPCNGIFEMTRGKSEEKQQVTFKNGVAQIKAKYGATVTIEGLPYGCTYEVTEDMTSDQKTRYGTPEIEHATGVISETVSIVTITNTHETADLTLSKALVNANDALDKDIEFTFKITLNNKSYEPFECTLYRLEADGTKKKDEKNVTFIKGEATVKVKGDQTVTISGLPVGVGYSIEEEKEPFFKNTKKTNDSGTITTDGVTASFTNERVVKPVSLTVTKSVEGVATDNTEFTFTVTLGDWNGGKISGTFGDMEFKEGVATFKLKHGQKKTATGLPSGITYNVEEADVANYYLSEATGVSGTINADAELGPDRIAAFINAKTPTGGGGGGGGGNPPTRTTATPTPTPTPDKDEPTPAPTPTPEPKFTSVAGKKTWDDNDDAAGKRPESITIHLFADSAAAYEEVASKVVTAADGWAWSFTNLPELDNYNLPIDYSIKEDPVPGYTTTISGFDVTNSMKTEYTSATVVKDWQDDDDPEHSMRPVSLKATLYSNETAINIVYLTEDNNWTATVDDLPVYANGERITYTWKEEEVLGYQLTDVVTEGTVTTFTNSLWEKKTPPEDYTPGPQPGNPEDEIDDYGTPLGLGIIINHVGDCFD